MEKFADKMNGNEIIEAMKSGDEAQIKQAWNAFQAQVAEKVKKDFAEMQESNDAAVLAQRGYRQLTSAETKWYQKLIKAGKSSNPKQAFVDLLGSDNKEDIMPSTIIEDVYKNLEEEFPLLKAINFQYVGYLTKWILNDHATQTAVWGTVTAEIVKEITSAFKVVNVEQSKLSAYAIIEHGMLDLGPTFLDGYLRKVLMMALMGGLEIAIVAGTGVDQPIGLIKNISKGASFNGVTGYDDKATIAVTDFTPKSYGALVARMAKTEDGKTRKIAKVGLIVNQTDYLTKVMPATTVLNSNGTYVNDLFPFPTTVYVSNVVNDGKAVMFIENEYNLLAGGKKNGVIEFSDEYKFLEDQRVFKVKQYAAGRAFDNTSAIYLDISNLDPAYLTVKSVDLTA